LGQENHENNHRTYA